MRIGCSSLTTRLFQRTMAVSTKDGRNLNPGALYLRSVLWTIRRVSELGLKELDLCINSEDELGYLAAQGAVEKIRKKCVERGVSVEKLACPFVSDWAFRGLPSSELRERWKIVGSLANPVGAKVIELTSPVMSAAKDRDSHDPPRYSRSDSIAPFFLTNPWTRLWSTYVEGIRMSARVAETYGLGIAIEPRPREVLSTTDSLLRLFDAIPSENLGGLLDVSHLQMAWEAPELSIRKLGKKVFGLHLSDNDGVTDLHWAPGSGQINWPPIFEALRDIQYEGELSLDVSGLDIERELLDGSRFVERFLNGKA
jgi:sugar phosphate isomerase/epimerase